MVATLVLLLVHTPLAVASLKFVVPPGHTVVLPVIAAGPEAVVNVALAHEE